jgi:nitroimidazol reductase NimA-like FMN-containing flavoprotein (pyridoxamine 5'-phosphate oxidase superfamily)
VLARCCTPRSRCGWPTTARTSSRAIPSGFLWKDGHIVLRTSSNAYEVRALAANPRVALTIDTEVPYRAVLVRGTAS